MVLNGALGTHFCIYLDKFNTFLANDSFLVGWSYRLEVRHVIGVDISVIHWSDREELVTVCSSSLTFLYVTLRLSEVSRLVVAVVEVSRLDHRLSKHGLRV